MTIAEISLTKGETPLYRQLADVLAERIGSGELAPGERLPTHRALADAVGVTIGTVTRAYAEAERRGLVEARVGAGTYVRRPESPSWSFEQHDKNTRTLGYNIPPAIDRSEVLQRALQQLAGHGPTLNQLMLYQSPEGIGEHRHSLAGWLASLGVELDPEHLLFTSGAQHGVQLALQTLCRPGDNVLCERLTYPGLLSLARQQHLHARPVEMDEEGLLPEAVDAACRQHHPRLLYVTPTIQNPTTATMSDARRDALITVCREHGVLVLEDDVHGLLPRQHPAPLVNRDPEGVIHVGGLGKTLAPGLRLGYLQAPRVYREALVAGIQNHSWMISPLLTALAALLIEQGAADRLLQTVQSEMTARWERAAQCLSGYRLRFHPQGFHGWLELPDELPLSECLIQARARGLDVKSAELFTPPGYPAPPAIRIAASAPASVAELEQSLGLLREVLAGSGPRDAFTL
ncbi:PLP-dependent aminotransferase family protein [Parahaliea maris]|uniref:PLP-dependent aminotransferase family protein n=1 Tax=Parahaliea maris TaxID=2716870 RepID=A0A5C8ZQI9_9GAMM|nr:PLP-dependent aminotransferase family protein [Parahaliea maris]TXS90753.1 PLP-dependent aminotransferase family protein [Parahaliea maris]